MALDLLAESGAALQLQNPVCNVRKRSSYKPGNMAQKIFVGLVLIAAIGLQGARAESYDAKEFGFLLDRAVQKQYVRVHVDLDIDVPLIAPDKQPWELRSKVLAKEDAVLAELGKDALQSTVWRTGLGQIGVYVTQDGLRKLARSANVRRFARDMTAESRATVYSADGRLAKIEAEIERVGYAVVEVVQNLENFELDLDGNGRITHRQSPAQLAEVASKRPNFLQRLPARGVLDLATAMATAKAPPSSPAFTLRVNKEGYFHLKEHPEVRSLRLADAAEVESPRLDPEAIAYARKHGYADVFIDLQRFTGYSPMQGKLPAAAWKAQDAAMKRAFAQILNAVTPDVVATSTAFEGIASIFVRLPRVAIERIFAAPDPRILGVSLNKRYARPFLAESSVTVNMPQAWNIGLKGSGQYVAILDSGVERTNPFLQTSTGQPKVVIEGCFGTNDATWSSFCGPNQDWQGDSSGPGVAAPCPTSTYSTQCSHGTHVAGIAAGRPNGGPTGVSGMAPDAQILAMQVFSAPRVGGLIGALEADVARALAIAFEIGYTNLTVNMSFGDGLYTDGNSCHAAYDTYTFEDSISKLKSVNVPVVAATGNSSKRDRIAWPACLPNVIKVGIVDDVSGEIYPTGNLADPILFNGMFLLAPGIDITSSVAYVSPIFPYPYGNNFGTSQAAPHVAGIMAVIKAQMPGATVDQMASWLYGNGKNVTPLDGYLYTNSLRRVWIPDF